MYDGWCNQFTPGSFTPKAFANFSPGFERRENPGIFTPGSFTPKAFANFSPGFERTENPGIWSSSFRLTLKGFDDWRTLSGLAPCFNCAGTSLGNVYNYYRTKEEILGSIIGKYQTTIDGRLRAIFDEIDEPLKPESLVRFGQQIGHHAVDRDVLSRFVAEPQEFTHRRKEKA